MREGLYRDHRFLYSDVCTVLPLLCTIPFPISITSDLRSGGIFGDKEMDPAGEANGHYEDQGRDLTG